ncbi:hypothetical protein FI667_g300, partial [Globisporangium splendens]
MSAIGALRQLEKEKSKDASKGGLKVRSIVCMLALRQCCAKERRHFGAFCVHDLALFTNLPSRIRQSGPVKTGITFAKASWTKSSRWIWIFSTTMLITLVPLSIEVNFGSLAYLLREEQTNEIVKELLGKGFTYNQIQGMGYSVSAPQSTLAGAEGSAQ